MQRRAMIVEDDAGQRRMFALILEAGGWSVAEAADGQAALALLSRQHADVIVLDLELPRMSGLELLEALRARTAGAEDAPPVVVVAADGTVANAVEAMRRGAGDFLVKPIYPRALLGAVEAQRSIGTTPSTRKVRSLAEVEAEEIAFALDTCRGCIAEVARRLGIGRSTLYRKMADYGIDAGGARGRARR